MGQIKRLVEYQPDKQRTPEELIEFLAKQNKENPIETMIVIYTYQNDSLQGYAPAALDRNYKNSTILWDIEQWKMRFVQYGE